MRPADRTGTERCRIFMQCVNRCSWQGDWGCAAGSALAYARERFTPTGDRQGPPGNGETPRMSGGFRWGRRGWDRPRDAAAASRTGVDRKPVDGQPGSGEQPASERPRPRWSLAPSPRRHGEREGTVRRIGSSTIERPRQALSHNSEQRMSSRHRRIGLSGYHPHRAFDWTPASGLNRTSASGAESCRTVFSPFRPVHPTPERASSRRS